MVRVNIMWRFVSVGMCFFTSSLAFGAIENTVTVTGTGPAGPVTASDTESVDVVDANPSLLIAKLGDLADTNNNGFADVGEVITYTFEVKNVGKVTLTDVGVTDTAINATGASVEPINPILISDLAPLGDSTDANNTDDQWGRLAPGDTVSFEGDYTVVQSDLDTILN